MASTIGWVLGSSGVRGLNGNVRVWCPAVKLVMVGRLYKGVCDGRDDVSRQGVVVCCDDDECRVRLSLAMMVRVARGAKSVRGCVDDGIKCVCVDRLVW